MYRCLEAPKSRLDLWQRGGLEVRHWDDCAPVNARVGKIKGATGYHTRRKTDLGTRRFHRRNMLNESLAESSKGYEDWPVVRVIETSMDSARELHNSLGEGKVYVRYSMSLAMEGERDSFS